MPGPGNQKARQKRQSKKEKNARKKDPLTTYCPPINDSQIAHDTANTLSAPLETLSILRGESRASIVKTENEPEIYTDITTYQIGNETRVEEEEEEGDEGWESDRYERDVPITYALNSMEPEYPYIYDPGNGPRVRDFLAFLKSPFAAPQTVEFDALGNDGSEVDLGSGELTASRVIPLLTRILPGEFAAVLWYNRTRTTHRVCPACRRVYHLGEALKAHVDGLDTSDSRHHTNQHTLAEQYLSGTCSVPCFALSTYNYGPAAVLAYGLAWHQLDEGTRELLEGAGAGIDDQGLSLYIRISRCDGAGLRELIDSL